MGRSPPNPTRSYKYFFQINLENYLIQNKQRIVRSPKLDRPPFKMFGHPNACTHNLHVDVRMSELFKQQTARTCIADGPLVGLFVVCRSG